MFFAARFEIYCLVNADLVDSGLISINESTIPKKYSAYVKPLTAHGLPLYCKEHNIPVIAITCPELTDQISKNQHNRHPSGKSFYELADVVINDYTPLGEAIVPIEGCDYKASPASTIINLFIVDAINAKVCEILAARGEKPAVWVSGNCPDGDRINQENMDKWFWRLRHI